MKKNTVIPILLLFLLCKFNSQGQNLSVEIAPSVSFLSGNTVVKELHKPILSYYGGITAEFHLKKSLTLVTGIGVEQKGSVVKIPWTDFNGEPIGDYNLYSKFDYLSCPILLRISFGTKINYYFNGGFYYSYLIRAKLIGERPNLPNYVLDNRESVKNSDIGFSIGGGIKIRITPKMVIPIEIRSNHGLLNISKLSIVNNGTIKMNATHLIVGLSYNFSNKTKVTHPKNK
jgi:opacity protein-like surface antigen